MTPDRHFKIILGSVNFYFSLVLLAVLCVFMSTPLGGGHIIFAFSAVRRPTWFPDI